LQAWLAAIARREAFRHHTRRPPEPVPTVEPEGQEDEHLLAVTDRPDLDAVFSRLDERDRILLHLRYVEDLSLANIADLLQIPEGTVKVRLHRLRTKLRSALERYG
jgi:RNA polymerase sigma-70 factor (ECF subfamily)